MAAYINPAGEYPRYPGDIQIAHPGWELGDALPEGWIEVQDAEPPVITEGQTWYEEFPTEVDGVYTRTFGVRDLTEEELARVKAPVTAKEKLIALGFTEDEINAIVAGIIR